MTKRIAINGFGRIGRAALRIVSERRRQGKKDIQIVAINDTAPLESMAHLLKYDSVFGRFPGKVELGQDALIVDGEVIHLSCVKDPKDAPWKTREIDVVFEATGAFLSRDKAALHVQAGAKKVLISAPYSGQAPDATICYGLNHESFEPHMQVVSTASCTTNCIVPIAKVINDCFGIEKASVTTIHSYTSDQKLLDNSHKDLRRARAAALSMIPTTTGAAKAVELILPELKGRFDGMAIRVPTPNVSCIDMVALLKRPTTVVDVNFRLKEAALGPLSGIMAFCEDPVVSVDMVGTNESSIVDALSTRVLDGNMLKILAWYDNEWGFTNRAVDTLTYMAKFC